MKDDADDMLLSLLRLYRRCNRDPNDVMASDGVIYHLEDLARLAVSGEMPNVSAVLIEFAKDQ